MFCAIELSLKGTHRNILDSTYYAFFVLLPVTGWVAESWLGRYRAILVGLILSAATIVLFQISFVMLHFDWTLPVDRYVTCRPTQTVQQIQWMSQAPTTVGLSLAALL